MKRVTNILTLVFLISITIFSCKKDEITDPDNNDNDTTTIPTDTLILNDLVDGNNLLLSNKIFNTDKSSIYEIIELSDGYFAYRGSKNGASIFSKIDKSGNVNWEFNPNFTIYKLKFASFNMPDNEGLLTTVNTIIAVGGEDTNNDEVNDRGLVVMYDLDGNEIDRLIFDEFENVYFSDFIRDVEGPGGTGHEYFYITGSCNNGSDWMPVIAKVDVPTYIEYTEIRLDKINIQNFDNYPSCKFVNILENGVEFIVSGEHYTGTIPDNVTDYVFILELNQDLEVVWKKDIETVSGFKNNHNQSSLVSKYSIPDSRFFLIGHTETEENQGVFITSFEANGAINYTRVHNLSNRNDDYKSIMYDTQNNLIYVGGHCGHYYTGATMNKGYAIISKINPETGVINTCNYFGNSGFRSSFNTILFSGNRLFGAGYTNGTSSNYEGWLTEIDLSNF